jgi:hypothetical protein
LLLKEQRRSRDGARKLRQVLAVESAPPISFGIAPALLLDGGRIMDFQPGYEIENANGYRVEVSGWDASEKFFVEKTTLTWGSDEKKEITLRSSLREGSVVFVRLLQAFAKGHHIPIPYQAASVTEDAVGRTLVRLARLRPRVPFKETAAGSSGSESKVA